MNDRVREPLRGGRDRDYARRRGAWLGAIAALLVALLIMSNVLLWQIADRTSGTNRAGGSASASQPLLPPPSTGTSNRAQASELDRLSRTLGRRFGALQSDLAPLPQAVGKLSSLDELATQGRALSGTLGQAGAVASRQLNASNNGIALTNRQLGDVSGKLSSMNGTLAGLGRRFGGVNRNTADVASSIATTNANINSLRSDIQQLNAGFRIYFSVYCGTLTPQPPDCKLLKR